MRTSGRFRVEGWVQREPEMDHVVFGAVTEGAVRPGMRATGPGDGRGLWGLTVRSIASAERHGEGRVRLGVVFAEDWACVEEVLEHTRELRLESEEYSG